MPATNTLPISIIRLLIDIDEWLQDLSGGLACEDSSANSAATVLYHLPISRLEAAHLRLDHDRRALLRSVEPQRH